MNIEKNLRTFVARILTFVPNHKEILFLWSFCEMFSQRRYDSYHTNSYAFFFCTLRLHASDTSEIRKKIIDIRNPTVS